MVSGSMVLSVPTIFNKFVNSDSSELFINKLNPATGVSISTFKNGIMISKII